MAKYQSIYKGISKRLVFTLGMHISAAEIVWAVIFLEGCKDSAGNYLQRQLSWESYSLAYLTGH